MESFVYHLRDELVEEILLRLPATSLLRFKAVCKPWNSLISDQRFINNHLHFNANKTRSALSSSSSQISLVVGWTRRLDRADLDGEGDEYRDLDARQVLSLVTIGNKEGDGGSDSGDLLLCGVVEIDLPILPALLKEGQGFLRPLQCYHCNGILCLVDISPFVRQRVAFFNPARKQCKYFLTSESTPDFTYGAFGFGCDSKTGHYKFVRILTPVDQSRASKAEVYNLGTNSCKVIQLDRYCLPYCHHGAYLNGVYYWLFWENASVRILAFDMSEEDFSTFAEPYIVRDRHNWTDLVSWNESLVYFNFPEKGVFEMWVMGNKNNNCGDVVWTKHPTIGPLADILKPVMFWKTNELLMETNEGRMVSYDLCTKKFKNLPIDGVLRGTSYAQVYVESLISVFSNKTC